MATIQFENGIEVEFDGDPTPQDVEEVANALGINKPPARFAPQSGLKGYSKGIAKEELKIAQNLGAFGQEALQQTVGRFTSALTGKGFKKSTQGILPPFGSPNFSL